MLTFSETQKRGWLEEFSSVMALYQVFNESRDTHRPKRTEFICDEVPALPIDFMIDVELKAKRVLPPFMLSMFLRLTENSTLELLPEAAKVMLGKVWMEYGLGVEGGYKSLYFKVKNEQMRSFLKGVINGSSDSDNTGSASSSSNFVAGAAGEYNPS